MNDRVCVEHCFDFRSGVGREDITNPPFDDCFALSALRASRARGPSRSLATQIQPASACSRRCR